MALLANGARGRRRQFCGVDDGAGYGPPRVLIRRTVAALARNRLFGEYRARVPVDGAGNMQGAPGATEDALLAHRPREIRFRDPLEPRGQIVSPAIRVITDRRLRQVVADLDKISGGVTVRFNNIRD